MADIVDSIIKYEEGELTFKECIELFSNLIKSGQVWQLQGSYGRTAQKLIDTNMIDKEGVINDDCF